MKKTMMLTAMLFLILLNTEAQVIVKIRPMAPMVTRSVCPSNSHVWVAGSWNWNRKTRNYHWSEGYWARPRRHASICIEGYWRAMRGGWRYVLGHWA